MAQVTSPPQPVHELGSLLNRLAPLQKTNEGAHIDSEMISWLIPTPNDTPLPEIRSRYERDEYVWLKNIIPRDAVLEMRERYFRTISPTGILKPATDPIDGLFDASLDPSKHQGLGATPAKTSEKLLDEIHKSAECHEFLKHPDLRAWVRRLTGWESEVILDRGLMRHNVPGSRCPSGIRYDQLFLRAGDPVFLTAWLPIGDCAADGGGLMYLEDSTKLGEHIEERFKERQSKEDMPREERISAFNHYMGELGHLSHNAEDWAKGDGLGKRWLVADYEAGDVVFHGPWAIHAASHNDDPKGRIRLASDLRFYEEGARLDERWTTHFYHGDGL